VKGTEAHVHQILFAGQRAVAFKAWRIPESDGTRHSYPLNVSAAIDLKEALHLACAGTGNFMAHKDHLLIERADGVRGRSHIFLYRIVKLRRRYTAAGWEEPLEPRFVTDWPVWSIGMVGPPDVVAEPTGIDRNIIEGKA